MGAEETGEKYQVVSSTLNSVTEAVWWGAEVVGGTQRVLNPALGDKFSIRSKEFSWSVDSGWCLRARLVEIHLVLSWTPNSISPTVKPSLR